MTTAEIIAEEKSIWTRSAPADPYYQRDREKPLMMKATGRLSDLCKQFESTCVNASERERSNLGLGPYQAPKFRRGLRRCKGRGCGGENGSCNNKNFKNKARNNIDKTSTAKKNNKNAKKNYPDSEISEDDDSSSSDSDSSDEEKKKKSKGGENKQSPIPQELKPPTIKDVSMQWLEYRKSQPDRIHPELWENRFNEVNDGPACRCSIKAKSVGIRHGIYQGEEEKVELDPDTNNFDKLYHYHIVVTPNTNFLVQNPTVIEHDEHEFIFEGFSLFTSEPLKELPECKVVRFNIEYSILYFEEKVPDNFTLGELKLFHNYFFRELLELLDWDINDRYYFMPRFVRELNENGKEILSMNEVLKYLLKSYKPLVDDVELVNLINMNAGEWLDFADKVKGSFYILSF